MKKRLKLIVIGLLVALIGIQFVPNNLPIEDEYSENNIMFAYSYDPDIDHILIDHCMDCHSNKITTPWYYKIKPLTFWLNGHINEGREHLNFDDWKLMDLKERNHNIQECIEVIEDKEMPLSSYQIMHDKMSDAKREKLVDWLKGISE